MTDYIDIGKLPYPRGGKKGKWVSRLEEWGQIPAGKAIEITDAADKFNLNNAATSINITLARKDIKKLRAVVRSKRLFIINEAKA